MKHAYILINCDAGSEKALIEQLRHLNNVAEVHGTLGPYDIVAKIQSGKPEIIKQTITDEIRKLEHVRSTLTLLGIDYVSPETTLAEMIPDVIPEEKKPIELTEEEEYDEDDNDEEEFKTSNS